MSGQEKLAQLQKLRQLQNLRKLQELRSAQGTGSSAAGEEIPGAGTFVEEMHPDIAPGDRAVVKNLSNSPEASLGYLKKKYPSLSFKTVDDRIFAKGDNGAYYALDPEPQDFKSFAKDLPNDLSDLAYDVPAGVVQGGAEALGGAAGALATFPSGAGAVPAAMAAGAAAGGGLEAFRQKLGQMLGIDQEVNAKDVGISAGLGALVPGLMGVPVNAEKTLARKGLKAVSPKILQARAEDKVGKQAALALLPDEMAKLAGEQMTSSEVPSAALKRLEKNASSPVLRAYDAVEGTPYLGALLPNRDRMGAKIVSKLSGVDEGMLEQYRKKYDVIKAMEQGSGSMATAKDFQERLRATLAARKNRFGQELEAANTGVPSPLDIGPAKSKLQALINERKSLKDTPANRESVAAAEAEFNHFFRTGDTEVPYLVKTPMARDTLNPDVMEALPQQTHTSITEHQGEVPVSYLDKQTIARETRNPNVMEEIPASGKHVSITDESGLSPAEKIEFIMKILQEKKKPLNPDVMGRASYPGMPAPPVSTGRYSPDKWVDIRTGKVTKPGTPWSVQIKTDVNPMDVMSPIEALEKDPVKHVSITEKTVQRPYSMVQKDTEKLSQKLGPMDELEKDPAKWVQVTEGKYTRPGQVLDDALDPKEAHRLEQQLSHAGDAYNISKQLTPRHGRSTPVADQELTNTLYGLSKDLNSQFDTLSGGKSAEARAQYEKYSDYQKTLNKYFKDAGSTDATLRNLHTDPKGEALHMLKKLELDEGVPVLDDALTMGTYNVLGKGRKTETPWDRMKQVDIGMTPAGKAGAALGAASGYKGGDLTQVPLKAAYGGVLGQTLGGPGAIDFYTRAGRLGRQVKNSPWSLMGAESAAYPAWRLLQGDDE